MSAPAASPERYAGTCPVTVSFAAKVSLTVDGKATLAYRWLRSDGSKSAVKTFTVRGSGKRTVTLTEKATVKKDSKGWRALELLSPRKATSGKASFSVSCSKPHKPSKPSQPGPAKPGPTKPGPTKPAHFVKVSLSVPDFTGVCPPARGVTARGVIKLGHPAVVKYRWVLNGKVVATGSVKVVGEKVVTYTFKPARSQTGWVKLEVLTPHRDSAQDAYTVRCEKEPPPPPDPVEASASVTAPESYAGYCPPITRVFTGTISVSRIDAAGTTVQYRWAGPGFQGPTETLAFAQGDPLGKQVSHTVEVSESADVERWIEILSPNAATSDTATVAVACESLSIQIIDLRRRYDSSVCGTPGYGLAITVTAVIRVNGPVRVEYEWDFTNGSDFFTVPGAFETAGPSTVDVAHTLQSSPFTASDALRATIRVTSPVVRSAASDFSPPPCPAPPVEASASVTAPDS